MITLINLTSIMMQEPRYPYEIWLLPMIGVVGLACVALTLGGRK